MQGFDDEVGMVLKQIYPPTMMMDLEASSQDAIIELAKAFPYQPSAEAAGLNRFQKVRAAHAYKGSASLYQVSGGSHVHIS